MISLHESLLFSSFRFRDKSFTLHLYPHYWPFCHLSVLGVIRCPGAISGRKKKAGDGRRSPDPESWPELGPYRAV